MREADGLPEQLVVLAGDLTIGMQRVAVARQRADRQAGIRDHGAVVGRLAAILQEALEIEMPVARPAAGSDFKRLYLAERPYLREHLLDAQPAEYGREETKFQRIPPTSSTLCTFVHVPALR